MSNKEDLQQELTTKGIDFDKRWGEAKLKLALEEAEKSVAKPEDKIDVPTAETVISEEVEKTIQALRENAKTAKEMVEAKKPKSIKESHNLYQKRDINKAVEVYEVNSGKFVRAFTENVHGKEYKEIAEQFIQGRIKKGMGVSYGKIVSKIIRPIVY